MSRKKLHTKKLRSQKTPETSGVFYDKPEKEIRINKTSAEPDSHFIQTLENQLLEVQRRQQKRQRTTIARWLILSATTVTAVMVISTIATGKSVPFRAIHVTQIAAQQKVAQDAVSPQPQIQKETAQIAKKTEKTAVNTLEIQSSAVMQADTLLSQLDTALAQADAELPVLTNIANNQSIAEAVQQVQLTTF